MINTKELAQQALQLTQKERADLARRLITSIFQTPDRNSIEPETQQSVAEIIKEAYDGLQVQVAIDRDLEMEDGLDSGVTHKQAICMIKNAINESCS